MLCARILWCLSGALLLGALFAAGAQAQVPPPYLNYTAKFTCGTETVPEGDDVVAGVYATSINIHNPQATVPVFFVKKIVVAQREDSGFVQPVILRGQLQPDFADFVDCTFIFANLPATTGPYVEGFIVLEVPPLSTGIQPVLDVVAKYTARASTGEVSTQNVVAVTGTAITF